MLHQISWSAYAVSIVLLLTSYYLIVGLLCFRTEITTRFRNASVSQTSPGFTGRETLTHADPIMGKAMPDAVAYADAAELTFGPPGHPDEEPDGDLPSQPPLTAEEAGQRNSITAMKSEVRTLIRVINESGESKENFEMLFRLIVQKFPELRGTPYQQQLNDYLLDEGAPNFPFTLRGEDLENYWNAKN